MDLHLFLDEAGGPLSRQIYDQIRDAIMAGRLRPGERLPSTRALADALGVSRNTVSAAFDHLTGEGFLAGRAGSGTFVSDAARFESRTRPRAASPLRVAPTWRHLSIEVPDFSARQPAYDFRLGIPDSSRFPYATWRRLVTGAFRQSRIGGAYADAAGHPDLRSAIARHLAVSRGVRVDPGQVLVTSGVQQATTLVGQVLVEPGDVVAMEDPGYRPVRRVFEAARATVVDVPVDAEGIVVGALPERARVVYVSPAHQFPLGVAMSLPRRLALLAWAQRADAAILEDDYDADFRYAGRPVDPLQALDTDERVVYVGSFSKSMLPALRLGYCVVPRGLESVFRRAKFVNDWHNPLPEQLALAAFIDGGHLARHIRGARRDYQARRDRIVAGLVADFQPWLRPIPTVAGLHLAAWANDASAEEVEEWQRRAGDLGVAVEGLASFAHGSATRPGLALGFGGIPLSAVDEGLRRLRRAIATTSQP
ncbi:MAG TPA: PLP-dependent aminotransferase family protein [Nocardioidaceae bacterium]|nr:PLP-dependent aminotransferase family protein [Nocardioidaceae bacterium]